MDQTIQLARITRSCMYRLLASLFARELTEENLISFKKGPGSKLLDALEEVEAYSPAVTLLKKYFATIADPKKGVLDLAESYAWNFHGVGGPHGAPLYASVYVSEKSCTHQKIERELHTILLEHGLSSVNYKKEPCDHLAVILEFVSWLDEQVGTDEQLGKWQKTRKVIIEQYLLSWLSKFVSQCKRGDRLGFYSTLAEEILIILEADFKKIN